MSDKTLRMYGPRLKLMVNADRSVFTLLLDEFDDDAEESKIITIDVPRDQLREWVRIFNGVLRSVQ